MYPFTLEIEHRLMLAISTTPRVWKLVGVHLDPKKLRPTARVIVTTLRALNKKRPCRETVAVIQYLQWEVKNGKIQPATITAVYEMYETAEDLGGVGDIDSLLGSIIPIIRRDGHQAALDAAVKDYTLGVGAEKAAAALHKAATIGSQVQGQAHEGLGELQDIQEAAVSTLVDPLPTGIAELDIMLQGGLERGALGMFLAESGGGKSLALCHVAAEAIHSCRDVVYCTLELSEVQIRQRIYCNLLDMTPQELADDPHEAVRRYNLLRSRPEGIGRWFVKYLTPKVSQVDDVVVLLKDLRSEEGLDCELLCVDYEGKLKARGSYNGNIYQERGEVAEDLRGLVDVEGEYRLAKWLWTASQATRGGKHRKRSLTLDDVSDSMEKIRVADAVVSLFRTEDDKANGEFRMMIPKRRNAPAHGEIGPLPLDAARWRMTAMRRHEPW